MIIAITVQLALATIPRGRLRSASLLTSGTTSGTSGAIRNAAELSTTITPRPRGDRRPLQRDVVGHVEHRHVDAVERLGRQLPHGQLLAAAGELLPAERAEASSRISPPDVAPGGEQLEHDCPDGAGGSDDGERWALPWERYRPVPA